MQIIDTVHNFTIKVDDIHSRLTKVIDVYHRSSCARNCSKETELVSSTLDQFVKSEQFRTIIKECVDSAVTSAISPLMEKITTLEATVQSQADQLNLFKRKSIINSNKLEQLEVANNNLEQYTRRNNLRISGIPETQNEDTDVLVTSLAKEKLGVNISPGDIDRSHRIGKRLPEGTRSIIVKFISYKSRNEVIRNRRKLKGSKTVIREDLTKINQLLLKSANDNPVIKSAWSLDGRVYAIVNKDGP